ncbi:hypothetical protein B0T19DRAFT_125386 [Cercophora scortea]|uniref:Beta-ketoacyl synthase-like N-terminal domain-containing protein n=1 Tax=Cercophora scortea TaxID=314031 RepID=A0AAE0IY37_9PEZI|nr:hypothetical protein B0T19DRAFT_125386 [Cercophora scortea]
MASPLPLGFRFGDRDSILHGHGHEDVPISIVAIIGMSCRLPGNATSPDILWRLCAEGQSAWSEIPRDWFNKDAKLLPPVERQVDHDTCPRRAFPERKRRPI